MFRRFYLVELFGTNGLKSVRSNTVLATRRLTPPIEVAYKNLFDAGFNSVNVLCVCRISKKTADFIRDHINSKEKTSPKVVEDVLKKVEGVMQSTKTTNVNGPTVPTV